MVTTYQNTFRPSLHILLGEKKNEVVGSPLQSIEEYANHVAPSAAMEFLRWPPGGRSNLYRKAGNNFQESLDYLTAFLVERMAFLDELWLSPKP